MVSFTVAHQHKFLATDLAGILGSPVAEAIALAIANLNREDFAELERKMHALYIEFVRSVQMKVLS
jgi:hypothetical protein